jgi:Beta-glucosidase/6-phospho-beta-glucosidase/beta-galactosidase
VYEFFTKGVLDICVGIPVLGVKNTIKYKNKQAIGAADCIGLNYYSGAYMSNFKVLPRADGIPTQSTLATVYPEGFYAALKQVDSKLAKKLGIPIYITENGIATGNAEYRDAFYRSHLNVLSKAMQEGVDVRGYIVWALMDCFDWMEGYDFEYGVYSVDRKTQERKLKPGTEFLTGVIDTHKNKVPVSQKSSVKKVNYSAANCCDRPCLDMLIGASGGLEKDIAIENGVGKSLGLENIKAKQKFNIFSGLLLKLIF